MKEIKVHELIKYHNYLICANIFREDGWFHGAIIGEYGFQGKIDIQKYCNG